MFIDSRKRVFRRQQNNNAFTRYDFSIFGKRALCSKYVMMLDDCRKSRFTIMKLKYTESANNERPL